MMRNGKSFFRKFILTCNPWFLSSTVVLLVGIYSLYTDPQYDKDEMAQIIFSFSSLQVYEFLVLGTLFFFKRLRLLHDSVLLIIIGSLLLFVPYINLSYANELDESFSLKLGLLTLILSLLKLSLLKGFYKGINLPPMLLFTGLLLASANYLIPGFMHKYNGQSLESLHFMGLIWEGVVPLIAATLYFALFRLGDGGKLYERKWLPLAISSCWITVSLVNFFSINYVYNVEFRREYLALLLFLVVHIVRLMYPKKGSEFDLLLLTICALIPFFLRLELPIHFAIMLCLNAMVLLAKFKAYRVFVLMNLIWLILHLTLSWSSEITSHFRFILLGVFIISFIYAFIDKKYEHSVIVSSLYVLVIWEMTGHLSFVTYFQAFSLFMVILLAWGVEGLIEGRLFISCLAVIWLGAALYVGLIGLSQQVGFIAAGISGVAVLRQWFFQRYVPRALIYSSLFALATSFLMTYLSTMSRSFFIIMFSFTIFGLGIYMSIKKAKAQELAG